MRSGLSSATIFACALAVSLAGAACSERGQMYSDRSNSSAENNSGGQIGSTPQYGDNTAGANKTSISVTGCVQKASGMNNYVLTNLTGAQSSPSQRAQGYRIEGGDKIDQHIGKQVKVTGWVDSDQSRSTDTTSSTNQRDTTSSNNQRSATGTQASTEKMSYKDLPQLHVENVEHVSDNCGNNSSSSPSAPPSKR